MFNCVKLSLLRPEISSENGFLVRPYPDTWWLLFLNNLFTRHFVSNCHVIIERFLFYYRTICSEYHAITWLKHCIMICKICSKSDNTTLGSKSVPVAAINSIRNLFTRPSCSWVIQEAFKRQTVLSTNDRCLQELLKAYSSCGLDSFLAKFRSISDALYTFKQIKTVLSVSYVILHFYCWNGLKFYVPIAYKFLRRIWSLRHKR